MFSTDQWKTKVAGLSLQNKAFIGGHKAERELRAGFVYINTYDASDLSAPFGGYKQSGMGSDKSIDAIHNYCEVKTTWIELD